MSTLAPATTLLMAAAALTTFTSLAPGTASAEPSDPDSGFVDTLHTHGVYLPRDEAAWLAKIVCRRLDVAVDRGAVDSARFIHGQLPVPSTTEQAWQFLGAAVDTYCPTHQGALLHV